MTSELLSVDEMSHADRQTIALGTPGIELMERAGTAVADIAARHAAGRPIIVLCGPGNNGGDGYVAARLLKNKGHTMRLYALSDPANLNGDARRAADRWSGPIDPLSDLDLSDAPLVIDALFGAGLQRDIEGEVAKALHTIGDANLAVVAVDLPSGVNGNTGAVMGMALTSLATVTFFRKKPGHLIYPGRGLCGEVTVADIGIPDDVLDDIAPKTVENTPAFWQNVVFPDRLPTDHKYDRGHVLIFGGAEMTGAARLAARAARRIGAGLVTISAPPSAYDVYRAGDPGTIVEKFTSAADALADTRRNAVVVGPGLGVNEETRTLAIESVRDDRRFSVLDADALSAFKEAPHILFDYIKSRCVLTPHEGEFARIFNLDGDKLTRARRAAEMAKSVIVLKGADTVIAGPDGRAAINASAPPWLGTAGAGDVLAGIIAGLGAQGCPAFEAACAGVSLHGQAAAAFGPGLIAEDIAEMLPAQIRFRGQVP